MVKVSFYGVFLFNEAWDPPVWQVFTDVKKALEFSRIIQRDGKSGRVMRWTVTAESYDIACAYAFEMGQGNWKDASVDNEVIVEGPAPELFD